MGKYTEKLVSRRILIIGGTSGIGFCAAEACIEAGGIVVIASSNRTKVDRAVDRLLQSYPATETRISGLVCDIGNPKTIEVNLHALLSSIPKPINHIIFTAGEKVHPEPLETLDIDRLYAAGTVRFFAAILLGKLAKEFLEASTSCSLTLSSGVLAENPSLGMTALTAYAAGMYGMVRALALELAPLRVNAVAPGPVSTELFEDMPADNFEQFSGDMAKRTVLRKMGSPEQVAEAYMYTIRDEFLTGEVIKSNGGYLVL